MAEATTNNALRDWCKAVERSPGGRLRLSNVWHDCCACGKEDGLQPKLVQRLFMDVLDRWNPSDPADRAWSLLTEIVSAGGVAFTCQGEPVETKYAMCSTIMRDTAFERNLLNPARAPATASIDALSSAKLRRLPARLRRSAGEPYPRSPGRHFAWVTDTQAVCALHDKYGGDGRGLAEALRNKLGLAHLKTPMQLVELRIPGEVLATELKRPTFLDGIAGLVYRSKLHRDGWGCAVDLESAHDGFPEAVHQRVTITIEYEVHYLGSVGSISSSPSDDDVLNGVPSLWCGDYVRVLEEYLACNGE